MTYSTTPRRVLRLTSVALATAGLVLGFIGMTRPAAAAGDCTVPAATLAVDGAEAGLLASVNAYRGAQGRPPLAQSAALTKAATWMSEDMARRNYAPGKEFNHPDSGGRLITQRQQDCGYPASDGQENIYEGWGVDPNTGIDYASADAAFDWWKRSPYGHNEAMLDPRHRFAGVARACSPSRCFWSLELGTQAGAAVDGGQAHEDDIVDIGLVVPGLPYGPLTCASGYVWREAFPGDAVCVTPETRQQARADNAQAAARRVPGSSTCVSGYVWRAARPDDLVCVEPEVRAQAEVDNRFANLRLAAPGPIKHLRRVNP